MAADHGSVITIVKYELMISMLSLVIWWWFAWAWKKREKGSLPLPPGPRGLPLVGYLPFLRPDLHRFYAELARTYGPIFSLRLGSKLCVVLSSPSLAKEIFKDQDTIFANRDPPQYGWIMAYGGSDMVWSPNGPLWRLMRKTCVREVMATSRLDATSGIRRLEVRELVHDVYLKVGTRVDVAEKAFVAALNVISSTIWGGKLHGEEKDRIGADFRRVVDDVVEHLGKPNVSDFFPLLARFDLQGLALKAKGNLQWFDRIFDPMINERLKTDEGDSKSRGNEDILQTLLRTYKEGGDADTALSLNQVKALIVDLVLAGTDTTSTTIEWTMAQMLKQPEIMRKVQREVDRVVGLHQMVEEFHVPELHYLKAVVKEVMRLYPVVPLLTPRRPSQTSVVGGYTIPEGTQVLVNAWSIHRDPHLWDDPLEFRPERFLNDGSKLDSSLNDFRYVPFGSGRRVCVGIPLAERLNLYVLASLLHSFNWQLPQGTKPDMSEKFGIVMKKIVPLEAIPTPRLSDPKVYD
ncbi:geraniol 8-hydroxylase-like [Aristolochia californica]|uniref:geraniol 8-hydroxylase-like n=1 Tax=Aristolochia californica TaxID=171875 RepID=UPI0035D54D56